MAKKQLFVLALFLACLQPNSAKGEVVLAQWDRNLPNLTLENVSINAGSLSEAWKNISTEYLVRSVLVTRDGTSAGRPFVYQSPRCTLRELYDAIAAGYELTWTQDERTGVAWFYPQELSIQHVLSTKVHLDQDHFGLPMQTGVLEPLSVNNGTGIRVKQWGTLFQNTFNYAVDVPAGEYTIRDLLNLCCVANPTKTFFVQVDHDASFITAINLVSDKVQPVPVGALRWWETEVGPRNGVPAEAQVIAALANDNAKVRRAARNYLEAIIWNVPLDELAGGASSSSDSLWTSIGITSILVRSEQATHLASIEMMERLATGDLLTDSEPGLAVMTALDLARLTKDSRALGVVKKRDLPDNELTGIMPDACRVAALSDFVRQALDKTLDVSPAFVAIVRLAHEGKLDFKIADGGERSPAQV